MVRSVTLLISAAALLVAGCRDDAPPASTTSAPAAGESPVPEFDPWIPVEEIPVRYAEGIRFTGERYTFAGEVRDRDYMSDGFEFRRGTDQRLRLLWRPFLSEVVEVIAAPQIRQGDKWILHGTEWSRAFDSEDLIATDYVHGQMHGWSKAWYANRQLKYETQYSGDLRNGTGAGWYESGAKQWEAVYVDDEEVGGSAWREDGSVVP